MSQETPGIRKYRLYIVAVPQLDGLIRSIVGSTTAVEASGKINIGRVLPENEYTTHHHHRQSVYICKYVCTVTQLS